jgi:hypothetical protein
MKNWAWWLTTTVIAIQEVEIRRTAVRGQPGEKVREIPSQKSTKLALVIPGLQKNVGLRLAVGNKRPPSKE